MDTNNTGQTPNHEDLNLKINESLFCVQNILHKTHNEALTLNELQVQQWQKYKTEHEELSARLLSMRDKLTHTIMVPIGKKALMRGKLVHTNEILVCLGDGWFAEQSAKQAADVCQRRIQYCDEMLEKLRKEEELLTSRKSFALNDEVFTTGQTQEIIEPYDEEAEKQWRERHRQKEKEYRQKLAELKKQQNTKIETEQDLWKRLNDLDTQEELEDELDRLDIEGSEEGEDDDYTDESSDKTESDSNRDNDSVPVDTVEKIGNSLKRKVSFKEHDRGEETIDRGNRDEMIRIAFKHSDNRPTKPSEQPYEINSPSDIYAHYIRQRVPKSILKRSSSVELTPSVQEASPPLQELPPSENAIARSHPNPSEQAVKAVGEVVERVPSCTSTPASERPVSHFKAARLAKKR